MLPPEDINVRPWNQRGWVTATGHLISKLHMRLLPDNVEMQVFLNKNSYNE